MVTSLQQPVREISDVQTRYGVKQPSPALLEAVQDDSNRSTDWLWYADLVPTDAERCYCLERALYINSNLREARWALHVLYRRMDAAVAGTSPRTFNLGRIVSGWRRASAAQAMP